MLEIKILLKIPKSVISYNYHNKLHGYVCNLLNNNTYGEVINNFMYSNLIGGQNLKEGIKFNENPYFIIRFDKNNTQLKELLVNNLKNNQFLFDDLSVIGIAWKVIDLHDKNIFYTLKQSPILVSRNRYMHTNNLTDVELLDCEQYLKHSINNKAKSANFKIDENIEIKIIKQHNPKNIWYKGCVNKGRVFELQINANTETKKFILLNGLGRSCGCGFGFIY